MTNYYRDRLPNAMCQQALTHPLLTGAYLEHNGSRYWYVYDRTGGVITNWECRPFPGNNALVVTTQIELRQDLRGRGLGKFFHELRRSAYRAAGFKGELCTVRSDSEAQTAIVAGSGANCVATLPSDFGGTFNVWMLPLNQPAVHTGLMGDRAVVRDLQPAPNVDTCGARRPNSTATFCDNALGHSGNHQNHEIGLSWVNENRLYENPYTAYTNTPPATVLPVQVPNLRRPKKFAHRVPSV